VAERWRYRDGDHVHEETGVRIRRFREKPMALHSRKETEFRVFVPSHPDSPAGAFRLRDAKEEAVPYIVRLRAGGEGLPASRFELGRWLDALAPERGLDAEWRHQFIEEHLGLTIAEMEEKYPG